MSKDPNKPKTKADLELLTISRVERLLAKLITEEARQRVLTYLVSRHGATGRQVLGAQVGNCNAVPLVPSSNQPRG